MAIKVFQLTNQIFPEKKPIKILPSPTKIYYQNLSNFQSINDVIK